MKILGVAGALFLVLGGASLLLGTNLRGTTSAGAVAIGSPPATAAPATPEPTPVQMPIRTPIPTPRSFDGLQAQVERLLLSDGVEGAVSLIELGGGQAWSLNGDQSFIAASTYKLPLLMEEAQDVAVGSAHPNDELCYETGDWEDGWFGDYEPGACYSRAELDQRVGEYSDNTAAHILVRADGGGDALNAYAHAHGATESAFWFPNTTTSADLARLWLDEAAGRAGGAAAQHYLYPLLTNTAYEDGIPAGVPRGTTVVHKIGMLDGELNDAGLVLSGPRGAYVLTVCTDGADWSLIADVAQAVAQFEAA